MNCEEAKNLIHPLMDGELDASHTREIEAHVANCASCAGELAALRHLHNEIASSHLGYRAPENLRRKINGILPQPALRPSRRDMLIGFGLGAGLSAAAASAVFVMVRKDVNRPLLDEVVSAHLRALQPDHLTDVLSSDQHTVKPWFNGRLDLAPPVVDLSAQGFTLIGGRLDVIGGQNVAVIVYRRHAHIINLFVMAAPAERRSAMMETVQGFNVRHWSEEGLSLWAASDLNVRELQDFGEKVEAAVHNRA